MQSTPTAVDWLKKVTPSVPIVFTVCAGSGILASSGAINGYFATTNKLLCNTITYLTHKWFGSDNAPTWVCDALWYRHDQRAKGGSLLYSSSGVSAGTQASLQMIYEVSGFEKAAFVAGIAEFVLNGNGEPYTENGTVEYPTRLAPDPFAYHCGCAENRTFEEMEGNCTGGNFNTNNKKCMCPPGVGLDYKPKECDVPGECLDATGGPSTLG